jgi:hypothetical protein
MKKIIPTKNCIIMKYLHNNLFKKHLISNKEFFSFKNGKKIVKKKRNNKI